TARALWRRVTPPERLVIVGAGALAAAMSRKLELFPDTHATVVARYADLEAGTLDVLGEVDRVVYACAPPEETFVRELAAACREHGVKLSIAARGFLGSSVHMTRIADLPLFEFNTWDASRSTMLVKRVIDL